MAEITRQSTFPPILRSYNPAVSVPPNCSSSLQYHRSPERSPQKLSDHEVHEARSMQPQAVVAHSSSSGTKRRDESVSGTVSQKTSKSVLPTADKIKKEQHLELRRKRNRKAEATLMCWDSLMEQHRLKRWQALQQRVGIQRVLISKNDKLSSELRKREEEERLEKIQARKLAQKKLVHSLRSHIQRIAEHKARIAEKLNAIKLVDDHEEGEQANYENISLEELLSPAHPKFTRNDRGVGDDEYYGEQYKPEDDSTTTSTVYQMLGGDDSKFDTRVLLESLWQGKKMAAHQQIQPIIRRTDHLKQVASPSVKQCLEVYERPTAHDHYTDKPVPLSEVLHDIITKAEMGTNYSDWNHAIERMNRQLQRRAELMLRRRDPYNSIDTTLSGNEEWFTGGVEREERAQDGGAASTLEKRKLKKKASLLPKRVKSGGTSLEIEKKLPTFLTRDGDLVTGSLEELGDQLYCAPSKNTGPSKSVTDEWKVDTVAGGGGSSVFLTDLQSDSVDNINLEQKSTTKLVRELGEKLSPHRKMSKVLMGWQPLSHSALSEHSRVSQLPVKGLGHKAHGKYSMWRPQQSCALRVSE